MTDVETKCLNQVAIMVASDILQSAKALESELRKIEERKAQIGAQLEAAYLCSKRLSSFKPEIQGDLQCPRCWISREARSTLRPIPGTSTADFFRCGSCEYELSIPLH